MKMSDFEQNGKAIVLAAFGASSPEAIHDIFYVKAKVDRYFRGIPVRLTFTSKIVRNIWRRRRAFLKQLAYCPNFLDEVLEVKSPLATIADLQDQGVTEIYVQSLHVYAGEEYTNLRSYIDALNSIKTVKPKHQPFRSLMLGRPALGDPDCCPHAGPDMAAAVKALRVDAERARRHGAALVYVGHGNHRFTSRIYSELQKNMNATYPDVDTWVGVVEGSPGIEEIQAGLKHKGVRKVILAPLLLVLGEHAMQDIAGEKPGSFRSEMEERGIEVMCLFRGLGRLDSWADIYIEHIRDIMSEHTMPSVSDSLSSAPLFEAIL